MTHDELLDLFRLVEILDPASAHACAETGLLAFLLSEGYSDIVEAYFRVCPGSQVTLEPR